MARYCMTLLALSGLALLAAAVPVPAVPGRSTTTAPRSPLDLLDDHTRTLAPDMADPLPPVMHKAQLKAAPAVRAASADPYRLPTNLIPILYQVTLTPNFDDFTFSGDSIIIVNCNEDTNKIVLHSKEIVIDESTLVVYDARTTSGWFPTALDTTGVTYDTVHDFVTIGLEDNAEAGGRYQISFSFTGKLNDDLDGFYRSSYTTKDGQTKWLATTQFESTGARRAFPCWDEPSFKARFYINIAHDSTRNAVSNMPIVQSKQNDAGLTEEQYDGTLPISSYLIAFIVSDFEKVTNTDGNFSTYARHDLIAGTKASQATGQQALKLLTDYTGIVYALPKEDQAAIPDFAAGAMENWGLVTYREEYLIEQASQTIRIAEFTHTTICHELGHQWTGDLVTLDWWSHTWLNEGFADYFENFICDQIKPEWHLRDKGIVGDHQRAMELDVIEDQHAMSSPVSTPDEDSSKFDRISYSKGGAVIRMWENLLGLDVLKAGMHRYLSIHMFTNTQPEDLFDAINFEAKKAGVLPAGTTFNTIARTWTEQPGVPVVTAIRDYDKKTVSLSQERFFYEAPNRQGLLKQRWYIPVTIKEEGTSDWTNLKPTTYVTPADKTVSSPVSASTSQWVLVNPKAIGYYRVNYDIKNWNLLAKALVDNPTAIPSASRSQLLNDALALARGNQLDYAVALPLLNLLKAEREVAPWQTAVTSLSWLRAKLAGTSAWDNFLSTLNKLTAPAYTAVGYSGSTDHETRFLRYYVVSYACYAGNSDCIAQANTQLKAWLADSTTVLDADTQGVSMCYGLRGADAAANFAGLKAKWLAEKDADKRDSLLAALACAKKDQLNSLLTDSINGKLSGVDQNGVVSIWRAILNRPEQVATLFDFAKSNTKLIDSYFSSGAANSGAVKLLTNCIAAINSDDQLTDARWWVESNYKGQTGYDQLQQAFLKAYVNLDWYHSNFNAVADWFKSSASD